MNFVKLTSPRNNDTIYVNLDCVVSMKRTSPYTYLRVVKNTGDSESITCVRETPEEILALANAKEDRIYKQLVKWDGDGMPEQRVEN